MPTASGSTNPFSGFIRQVKELSVNIACFRRIDFHVHSPESHDFPSLSDKLGYATTVPTEDTKASIDERKQVFETKIRAMGRQMKVDAIAITDHHKSRYATEISSRIDIPVIFPGIEITIAPTEIIDGKVHLLAIFPQSKPFEEIESIIPATHRLPIYDQRNKDTVYSGEIKELVNNIHSVGGIVIAAHVNNNRGIRLMLLEYNVKRLRLIKEIQVLQENDTKNQQEEQRLVELQSRLDEVEDEAQKKYLKFLASSGVDAVQISKPVESDHYAEQNVESLGLNPFPCVLASDSHNSNDVALINNCSYIKVTSLNIDGIKKAFKDPGARIRYEVGPQVAASRIRALKIEGGFLNENTVVFSKNLTCLIGGRGSGKSSLVDAIRYLFNINCPRETIKDVKNRQKATLNGSTITALFECASGEQFIAKKQYVEEGYSPLECFQPDGTPRAEIRDGSSKFNIELYGWSEIELLSHNIENQRALLDRANPDNKLLIQSVASEISHLQQNKATILALTAEKNRLLPRIKELSEKEAEFKSLRAVRKASLKQQESKIGKYEKEIEKLEGQENAANEIKQRFEDSIENLNELPSRFIENKELNIFGKKSKQALVDIQKLSEKDIKSSVSKIGKAIRLIQADIEKTEALIMMKQSELEALRNDPEYIQYREILQRSTTLRREISSLKGSARKFQVAERNFANEFEKRKSINERIAEKRNELFENRKSVIQNINSIVAQINQKLQARNIEIKLGIEKDNDVIAFGECLDRALTGIGAWYKANHYADKIINSLTPSEFVEIILNDNHTKLIGKCGFDVAKAKAIVNHLKVINDDDTLNERKLSQLLELEECLKDDLPQITYNGKSVLDGLSPGQRCTALLPIIFTSSAGVPLIIDQPEDNLDSQLVFELVVDILRSLKEKRQVIIATHNANIPVSGDAEQVIVLEAESNTHTIVKAQASIDDEAIIMSVKELLEGGEDAFRIRGRKYGVIP